jgi:mersacidin/lichenicidin family type 2 lantibiotic
MSTKQTRLNVEQIIKAWKDPAYRQSLSALEIADLPENPAGVVELSAAQLAEIGGGLAARGGTFDNGGTVENLKFPGSTALITCTWHGCW